MQTPHATEAHDGFARLPGRLVRIEGLAVLAAALALYFEAGHGWLLLVVLFLAPDVSMLGYLAGPRVGSASYNAAHTHAAPVALAVIGVVAASDLAVQLGLIWLAHIGADRLLGYGLKYPTGFKDTHIERI